MTKINREGPKPRHQNDYAFKHNRASKLTAKILSTPNVGLCKRCHDIIEWKKAYRKYKPLTQPRRCNVCQQKTITLAYHVICDACAKKQKKCAKCCESYDNKLVGDEELSVELGNLDELEKQMSTMSLRKQHVIMREAEKLAEEERKKDAKSGIESDDDDDSDEEDFSDDE